MAIVGSLSWSGDSGPMETVVDGRLLIGSAAACGIVLRDAAPNHCEIVLGRDGYVVRDLTGQALLRVNGVSVTSQVLCEGDLVEVMSGRFRFSTVEVVETAVPAAQPAGRAVQAPKRRPAPASALRGHGRRGSGRGILLGFGAAALVLLGLWILVPRSSPPPPPIVQKPGSSNRSKTDASVGLPGAPGVEAAAPETPAEGPVALGTPAEAVPPAPAAALPESPRPDRVAFRPGAPAAASPAPSPAFSPEAPAILRQYDRPDLVDRKSEAAARSSPRFEVRYAGLLLQLHRAFAEGGDYEAVYRSLMEASPEGGPPAAAAHLRALAASLKSAVFCTQCKAGRLVCPDCEGQGKADQNCAACEGKGRVRPPGAVGKVEVSVKCRNCEGRKVFKGVGCSTCTRTGSIPCASCKGSPWRAANCYAEGCKEGRKPCAGCEGRGWVTIKCPFCTHGRAQAPGAVGGADVTMKCRNCEVDGQQGNGTLRHECRDCGKTGRVTCKDCGGVFSGKRGPGFREVPISSVFRTEGCQVASVAGGPVTCSKCVGLGVRIRPAADPSKVLD